MFRVLGAPGLGLCLLLAAGANAETFTVTTVDDMGAGSLRQAVLDANDSDLDPPHTIVFMLPADSTITLLSPLEPLDQDDDVSFDAASAPGLTLEFFDLELNGHDAGVVDLAIDSGAIAIGEADALTFTASQDFEVGADIGDLEAMPGELVKDGMAVLTLSGDNSMFDGMLTVVEGTVVGDTMSLPQTIANEGALVFDQDDDGTYAGVVSGSGTLEKRGDGNLTLTGPNDYAGGTTITAGTLTADEATSLPAGGGMVNEAALVFDQGDAPGDFSGAISGTGSVTKTGAQDLTLSGTNGYTGGTTVAMGTLIGDTAALQGDFTLDAGTTLAFVQDADGTFAGSIGGDGEVVKDGAGSVRMTGDSDYAGGTTVSAGTLVVDTDSLPGAPGTTTVLPGALLVFEQGFDGSFDGDLMGGGDLEKRGGGTLALAGTSTAGMTSITGGTLDVIGSLTSPVTVASAGTLSGNGAVTGDVTALGTVSPGGAAQDTLTVASATFESGSRLVVDMAPGDLGDQLAASGTVTIDPGASLVVRPAPGDYSAGTTVTILDASGLTSADPFDEGEAFAFLDRTVTYDEVAGTVTVMLMGAADFSTFDGTANQRAVASALDMLSGDPAFDELFENVNTLLESEAAPLLDGLSGEGISASTTARLAMGERLQRALHRRMRSVLFSSAKAWAAGPLPGPSRSGPTRRPDGPTDVAAPRRPGETGLGIWVDMNGILGDLDGDGNSADVEYVLGGATAGADFRIGESLLAGVAAGYVRSHVEVDGRDTEGDADTAQGAAYLAYATPVVYAGVSGRYAWSRTETRRDIDAGTLSATAHGDFDSHDYGLRGELALRAFEARDVALEPLAAFEWSRLTRESFDESGAGSLGLDVDDESLDSSLLQLGARVRALFPIGEEGEAVLAPELHAYWLHEFGDTDRRVEATLGGAPFTVHGAEAPRDGALVGTGWSVSISNVRATLEYDLRIDSDRLENVAAVTVRARF